MKLLFVIGILSVTRALAQYTFQQNLFPQNQFQKLPQISGSGGGSPKQGNFNFNVRQQVWQSPNQRHLIHGTAGYSRNWGEPKPENNLKIPRVGVGYIFKFN
ncbi:diptericin-D-like [Cochliomyia hominivorax]